jgi:hypothetical protein
VSYILDALKKAAEQRDAHAPAIRRLFSPVPEFTESPRWRLAVVGGAAAVAGAVIAVWVLWPAPPVMTEKALTTARVQPEAPPAAPPVLPAAAASAPAPPPAPVVRTAPRPPAVAKAVPDKRPTPTPAVQTRQAPVESVVAPAPAVATRQAPVESVAARPQPATPPPPVIAAVRPPIPTPAAPPAATPRAEVGGQLRLEVIVYSDERARRLAFINGRKYVEGDLLLDGSRIQEIQPNAVVIIEDGRRVVLKP